MSKAELTGAYCTFQGIIDHSLNKANPASSIPWCEDSPPLWAKGFLPKRIIDIGCAKAQFTQAVLIRLGQWGCLGALEEILLLDKEAGLIVDAERNCRSAVAPFVKNMPIIKGKTATVSINSGELSVDGQLLPSAGLIIASHVTYFFGQPGGIDLVEAVLRNLMPTGGLGWFVIRKRNCPIYKLRIQRLSTRDKKDDSPNDYAECLEAEMRAKNMCVSIRDSRDCQFLGAEVEQTERSRIASLLMWRSLTDDCMEEFKHFNEPLFSERHIILSAS